MSLFPGYSTQSNEPSTSKQCKKEKDSDDDGLPKYNSYSIAKAAKENELKREREKMKARLEEKKDKAAVISFNLGDTSSEDDLTMIVDRSESEDENTRRIYNAMKSKRKEKDELEERKRKNRERIEEKYRGSRRDAKKRHGSSSDSDSSPRRPKKKKKDKERDRYIEPDKNKYSSKSTKWRYMATVGVTVDNPNSYMMDEKKPDSLLNAMEKTEMKESPIYDQRFTAVLGAPYKINKLFFPTRTASRTNRVFDKPITLRSDPEYNFVIYKFTPGETIPLSTVRCDKQIEKTEEPTPEVLAARMGKKKEHERVAMESDPVMKMKHREATLAKLKKEHVETNSLLKDDLKNERLWMELFRLENEVRKMENRDATYNTASSNERKEAILKKALSHLPKSALLTIEMMKLKKTMNKPLDEINNEWKSIMNRLPNSIALWNFRIKEMINDSKQFNSSAWMRVVDQCAVDLKALLSGTMRSHQPEEGTPRFLVELIVMKVRMELAMGFMERAISTVQVLLEWNVFSPPHDMMQQFVPFEQMWGGNIPLVGEPEGRGWFHLHLSGVMPPPSFEWLTEIKNDAEEYQKALAELGRAAEKDPQMMIFARHERLHEKYYWRPVRNEAGTAEEDVDRLVELAELPRELYPPDLRIKLAINLVKELGGLFYAKLHGGKDMFDDPIGPRLFSFGLLIPSLHSVSSGIPQFVDRLINQMAMDDSNRGWEQAIPMSLARIRTHAWFIAQRETLFKLSTVMEELAGTAESAVRTWVVRRKEHNEVDPRNQKDEMNNEMTALTCIVYIYEALNLFEIHSETMNQKEMDKSIKFLVKNIISKARFLSDAKPLNLIKSDLNKSAVLVLATLLLRLPGSWDSRMHRVQCVIMGKDAKNELTLPEQLEAQSIVDIVRKGGVNSGSQHCIHFTISELFGQDFVLASAIEILFLFTAAAKSGSGYPKEKLKTIICDVHIKASDDDFEQFYCHYITIMKHGKKDFRVDFERGVRNHGRPTNVLLAREFINIEQKAVYEVSMLANLKKKAEEEPSWFNSLSRLYAHRRQFARVVASAEMQSDLAIANRLIKVYIDEAKRHKDPLLWRYALNMAAVCRNAKMGEEVFTQAFADCSWSRSLHLDYIEAFPSEGQSQLLPMTEKNIRIRGDPDHVQTYIDHARREDGRT